MHANLCEPSDAATLAAFRRALQSLGAQKAGDFDSLLGVRMFEFRIGTERLLVFSDNWSLDIEGPEEMVRKILNAVAQAKAT